MFVHQSQCLTKIGARDSAGFPERHGAADSEFDKRFWRSAGAQASVNVAGFMVARG
jgi:hypothetical protein